MGGMYVAPSGTMRTASSRGLAWSLLLGLFGAVACGSDDDASDTRGTAAGTGGTAATGQSENSGAAGVAAGGGAAPAAGAGGMRDLTGHFSCAGPSIAEAGGSGSAGQGGQGDQTAPAVSCDAAQSFCFVFAGKLEFPEGGTVYIPECRSFSESATSCATDPSCACFCSYFECETECRCKESNGVATVTCEQI